MSKVDAQRAMREARFAAYRAKVAAAGTPPAPAAPRTVRAPEPVESPGEEPVPGAELCGHKNMGNKSCKRPAGHAEKSHRYK